MAKIEIRRVGDSTPSEILFPEDLNGELESRLEKVAGKVFFITDSNIITIYGDSFLRDRDIIVFPPGEENKTLETVGEIHRQLVARGANRDSFIVGFGGGIVTDVVGFVACTFMRGVRFGFIPTTLLAMVDASIGGKNGVNLDGYKNMVGNFKQPDWILMDPGFLKTLPEREFNAGMAEVLKYALIYDRDMFMDLCRKDYDLGKMIYRSAEIKAAIVEQDELEGGIRKVLNFGHTMAHAIEKCSRGRYLHGEAVAMGIRYSSAISFNMGLIDRDEMESIEKVIESLSLPLNPEGIEMDELFAAMAHDKKSTGKDGTIDEILLDGIGNFTFVKTKPGQ